ncbi:MAG TPA: VWA domain-containing protein, partial [Rudaea sp.]
GSQAYLLTPLTFDRDTVLKQLDDSVVGLPGRETAIGDAVGLAVKRLRERPQNQRVLILLTDGVNDAGELDPHKAVELAVSEKVKIYTIGIGAEAMRVDGFFGSQVVNPSADLDARLLTEMAQKTGGRFFRARNTNELAQIYRDIDRLEPSADAKQQFRPTDELFYWPLSIALLLALLAIAEPRLAPLRMRLQAAP